MAQSLSSLLSQYSDDVEIDTDHGGMDNDDDRPVYHDLDTGNSASGPITPNPDGVYTVRDSVGIFSFKRR